MQRTKKFLVGLLATLSVFAGLLGLAACVGNESLIDKGATENLHYQKIAGKEEYCVIGLGLAEESDIVISSMYKGLPVTEIGSNAFNGCASLTSIVVPDSVTSIGDYAFADCRSLTSFVIPDSVISIGDSAFHLCYQLTSVVIGDSVTSIGDKAFDSSSKLKSITIPDSVISVGNYAFSGCSGLKSVIMPTIAIKYVPQMNLQTVILTSGDSIRERDFYGCKSLTNITIPDSVTSIGNYAFSGCSGLTSVYIPKGVTSIGEDVFYACESLKSISVSGENTAYGSRDGVLYNKAKTEIVLIPAKITGTVEIAYGVISIGDYVFFGCEGLTRVIIPDSVTSIGNSAFYNCDNLTSIVIGDNVTSIGEYAFDSCHSLTNITCSVFALSYVKKDVLQTVMITSGDLIDNRAFFNCKSLIRVVIGDGVKTIGDEAFYDCDNLTSVVIGKNVTCIGSYAFCGCKNLKSITFNGALEEWNTIKKGSWWNYGVPTTKVVCSDGEVSL